MLTMPCRLLRALALIALVSLPCAPALAGDGMAALRLLPEDTALVISANTSRLGKSKLGKTLVAAGVQHGKSSALGAALGHLRTRAGFDIERDLDTVVLGIASDFVRSRKLWLIAEGRFDRDKLLAMARESSTSFERRKHRGIRYVELNKQHDLAFIDRYLVVTPRGLMPDVIDAHRKKARSAAESTALMALVAACNTTRDLWGVFLLPADLRQDVARQTQGHSIEALLASVDLSAGLGIAARIDTSSPAAAQAIAALLRNAQGELARHAAVTSLGLAAAARGATIQPSGARVELAATVGAADLARLEALLTR